ncbi:MAG: hypothetical protein AB8E15_04315 [Bdellovibrionales bacterium]
MAQAFLGMLSLFFVLSLNASLPNTTEATSSKIQRLFLLDIDDRTELIKKDVELRKDLEKISFGSAYHLRDRWKAFSSLISLKNQKSKKLMDQALKSKEWYMRDVALKSAMKYLPKSSMRIAKSLLNDPSLMVRTSAVKSIIQKNHSEFENILWKELYADYNFRKKQSLWVRKYIVKALLQFNLPKAKAKSLSSLDYARFSRLLREKDRQITVPVVKFFNNFVSPQYSNLQNSDVQRQAWLGWFKKNM